MTFLAIPADTPSGYGITYFGGDGVAGRMSCAWPLFCGFLALHYHDRATLVCDGVSTSFSLLREANFPASTSPRDGRPSAMPTRNVDGDR